MAWALNLVKSEIDPSDNNSNVIVTFECTNDETNETTIQYASAVDITYDRAVAHVLGRLKQKDISRATLAALSGKEGPVDLTVPQLTPEEEAAIVAATEFFDRLRKYRGLLALVTRGEIKDTDLGFLDLQSSIQADIKAHPEYLKDKRYLGG